MRLAFGLAIVLAITSPRQVTAGFFRIHLYVTLGLCSLAALVAYQAGWLLAGGIASIAAACSYVGSVCWLYERTAAGRKVTVLVGACTLAGALIGTGSLKGDLVGNPSITVYVLECLNPISSGLVLGLTMGAMFLGHWYLNNRTMEIAPLRRLLRLMVFAILFRGFICAFGLSMHLGAESTPLAAGAMFILLRWLTGILAPLVLAWMVAKTLAIPNTQSATGILYVAVIATFTGELMSLLLSSGAVYPL
jgi:hypothetical protein